jgi:copper chaperone CopZ
MLPLDSTTTCPGAIVTLAIGWMRYDHCVAAVAAALDGVPGVAVERVVVGSASVVLDPAIGSAAKVVAAVRESGYEARLPAWPLPLVGGACCCDATQGGAAVVVAQAGRSPPRGPREGFRRAGRHRTLEPLGRVRIARPGADLRAI